jgi:DNA topoisomerase-1
MKLVIVESPAKAKTINKYLGSQYKVIASFGHVRDLPSKNGSVLPDEGFAMKYEISDKSSKYINEIIKLAKQADEIYLAADPDREGESISWHVAEVLREKKIIKDDTKFKRIAFNEITKKAVLAAVAHPRTIDLALVNAQQARRALDYLVGFTLSPILWRKLPGCRSAGRVQSVALRIICEREDEIERFKTQEYWDIELDMLNEKGDKFTAMLSTVDGKKLDKFSITNEESAEKLTDRLKGQDFKVLSIQKKQQKRNPSAPFITSSLQQEASRKLGFGAKKTMQIAQKLYEGIDIGGETVGLITYIRTDGVTLSTEAVESIRSLIQDKYGSKYLPQEPRVYKSKSKNAQEAHEAVRPTDMSLMPESLSNELDKDQLRLYELIWKRTMACQMESVLVDMVGTDLISAENNFVARATGSTIAFDGFYKIYQEGIDDGKDEENKMLPPLSEGESIDAKKIKPEQHFTEAPPRYSEASLVKRLEELGIGRPSTYASIISVLQDRKYVEIDKKRFHPTNLGRLVTVFLIGFFTKYVEYDFTADLETDLDEVAEGKRNWQSLLSDFWLGFNQNVARVSEHKITDVIDYVEKSLDFHLFGEEGTKKYQENKKCPSCSNGSLSLKLGKYGAFLACSNYPDCTYKKTVSKTEEGGEEGGIQVDNTKELGLDPSGQMVYLKKGPYGWYVQLGEAVSKKDKPKRSQLPDGTKPEELTLEVALKLLNLPMLLGKHTESGEEIHMGIGKYGPYVKYMGKFTSIPKVIDPFSITLSEAMEIIVSKPKSKGKK